LKQVQLLVPKLGMDTTEALVTTWLVAEGDRVEKGVAVVELETEKVNFGVEAEVSGRLLRIVQPAGAVVPVGDVLAILEAEE
jgi:pyruvate/2-oxoglutarate dehydrogenase complex dihydrolipoamide acyltransferase (E2) component